MKPGLARALPAGIVGFGVGALIAIVIRLAQGLDPNPAAPYAYVGPAMVLGAFISAFFFVWGMGAFDPRMNVHGEAHHEEEEVPEEKSATTIGLLGGLTWQVTFWLILLVLAIAVFAFLPQGPAIQNVARNEGNVAAVGYVQLADIVNPVREFVRTATGIPVDPMPAALASVQISYLVLLVIFVIVALISLFLVAGLIAFIFSYFARGRTDPEGTPIPWRAIIFVGLIASFTQFPLMVPTLEIPMALLMPAFVLPQIVLLIVYRRPIWLILLLIALPLPILVPVIRLTHIGTVMVLLIGAALAALVVRLAANVVPEKTYRPFMLGVMGLVSIGVILITIASSREDIWQLYFLLFLVIVSLLLISPVPFLRAVIPASIWARFAAVRWSLVIPEFAGWLARLLRQSLPSVLGQR